MRISHAMNFCVAVLLVSFSLTDVKAANLDVSNLTSTPTASGSTFLNTATTKVASSFSTSSFTGTADIEKITLALFGVGSNLSTLNVGIYTDNAATPGVLVGNFYTATGLISSGNYDFNFSGTKAALSPSTNYWLVVQNTVATFTGWNFLNSATATIGNNATIETTTLENPTGIGWNSFPNRQYLFALAATAVPEPSTYAMGVVGVLTTACLARRRKKS